MVEVYLFLTLMGLLSSFLLSCSEAAIFSLSRIEMADLYQSHPEDTFFRILRRPEVLLFTLLAGNEISDFLASFFLAQALTNLYDHSARTLAFGLYSLLGFYLGDFVPKLLGYTQRRGLITLFSPFLLTLHNTFRPLNFLVDKLEDLLAKPKKTKTKEGPLSPAEQFILHLLDEANKVGKLSEVENTFIRGLFLSENIPVSAIMVPRSEIFFLSDQPIERELLQTLCKLPYSKVPVYRNSIDEVIGILHIKDLFRFSQDLRSKPIYLSDLVKPAYFVPEFTKVRDLIFEFQKRHLKLALVIDEYGILKGLITLEDLLEVLFGEFRTPEEPQFAPLKKISQERYLVHGNTLVYSLKEKIGIPPVDPEDESRSVNAYLLRHFEGIPKEGDSVVLQGWQFKVLRLKKNKIIWVEITKGET